MLKDCRECGQPVAARAKTCPNCGIKKPTATKAEAGLDAFAAGAFKLGLMICLLAVIVVACIAMVACTSDTAAAPPRTTVPAATAPTTAPRATETRAPTTTIRATTTAADPRPVYCTDYDTWTVADAEMDALEVRHGPDTSTWPTGDVDALFAAMDRRAVAVQRVWAQAPDSATITSVQAACAG